MGAPVVVDHLWEGYRPGRRRRLPWRGEWRWALRDISVSVEAGEILGIVGQNGSGKTTLLQSVAGVYGPTRGTVTTAGRVASLVDLSAGFHRDLTGRENLLIGGVLLGLSRRQVRERFDDIVQFAGIDDEALDNPLSTFSMGMHLRLGFALVVNTRPDVLLVDEVLAVGDEGFQQRCVQKIEELVAGGCAVLLASHDLVLVEARCRRLVVLAAGEQCFDGPVDEGLERYHQIVSESADPG